MWKKLTLSFSALMAASLANGQPFHLDRLPAQDLDVTAPSARVDGAPGTMHIIGGGCPSLPREDARRRIVDIAIQEWGFFGFTVLDRTVAVESGPRDRSRWRRPRLSPWESARVADSIAGYWSVTSDGGWILGRQNAVWNGPWGVAARWRDPWSAAFISWVMCEGGFGEMSQFRRHIAHYAYIDQAIEARDTERADTAFVAYDVGEAAMEPGDLVCSSRRGAYGSIADRRSNLGDGVRSHCDIVVKLDEPNGRILAIGGNVRGSVRLKLLPAEFAAGTGAEPEVRSVGRGGRAIFAHLKLRSDPIEADAFERSPTMRALAERADASARLRQRLEGELVSGCCQTDSSFERRYSVR